MSLSFFVIFSLHTSYSEHAEGDGGEAIEQPDLFYGGGDVIVDGHAEAKNRQHDP